MTLKEFLEAFCDGDMAVDVTDDWGPDYTMHYRGYVDRLLKYPDIYGEELKSKVKAIDSDIATDYDSILMILIGRKE